MFISLVLERVYSERQETGLSMYRHCNQEGIGCLDIDIRRNPAPHKDPSAPHRRACCGDKSNTHKGVFRCGVARANR